MIRGHLLSPTPTLFRAWHEDAGRQNLKAITIALIRTALCRACRRSQLQLQRGFVTVSKPQASQGNRVKLVEVGPRDGLQNEKMTIPLATKIELIERLARTGVSTIEDGAFVSPKWVPQMANSSEIMEHILQHTIQAPVPMTYAFPAVEGGRVRGGDGELLAK